MAASLLPKIRPPKMSFELTQRILALFSSAITLFSNIIFKGVGRHPKTGKKKSGIKVHANEGVPLDIRFTTVFTAEFDDF